MNFLMIVDAFTGVINAYLISALRGVLIFFLYSDSLKFERVQLFTVLREKLSINI